MTLFIDKRQFDTFSPWWKLKISNPKWKILQIVFLQAIKSHKMLQYQCIKKVIIIKSNWIWQIMIEYSIIPFIGDFWESLYSDKYLWFIIGPATILSIIMLVPAYFLTLYFIDQRHIKYVFSIWFHCLLKKIVIIFSNQLSFRIFEIKQ